MTTSPASEAPFVTRRQVYYLAGFDTRGPRFYHQLYKSEAARQQQINGCNYDVGELFPSGPHSSSCVVQTRSANASVHTTYTFLQWNDIIRDHWPASTTLVAARMPAFYWHYGLTGCLAKTRRLSRPFFWMILLPLLYASAGLLAAALAGLAAAWLASHWTAGLIAAVAGTAVTVALTIATLFACEHLRVFWLMRAWTFMVEWARHPAPLQQRFGEFARQIEAELQAEPADEVLIIGHSAGSMAAISVAESWLALGVDGAPRPSKVKLMLIGSATPLLGVIPEAGWFRAQVAAVGASNMPWIDYTAPADPLCYALVNPFTALGLTAPTRSNFKIKSARFDKMFDAAEYRKIRFDFFRIHFQYLVATARSVENDYFTLTAGPHPLVVDATLR